MDFLENCTFFSEIDQVNYWNSSCIDQGSMWHYMFLMNSFVWLMLLIGLILLECSILFCGKCLGLQLVTWLFGMMIACAFQVANLAMIAVTAHYRFKETGELCAGSNSPTHA